MEQVSLTAERREMRGKEAARKLRAAGKVPGVAYGRGTAPVSVTIDERDLLAVAKHGANVLIDLKIDGADGADDTMAILKELQREPTTDRILSADLQWISLTERISVAVPIELQGTAVGVEMGGILEQSLWELHVSVLPTAIPASIPVSVGHLEIGQSIHVSDLVLADDIEVLSAGDEPVVSVTVPRVEEEEAPEEEVEGEEVEGEEGEEAEAAEEAEGQPESDTES